MKKLVSVIMPVYNCEEFVEETIKSVLSQDYSDFELIVVDDGSVDNSFNICKRIDDSRIKCFTKKNGGPSSARNYGISKASGDYIMFIDSDDKYYKNSISTLVSCLEENSVDVAIGNYFISNSPMYKGKKDILFTDISKSLDFLLENKLFNVNWNKIYKREIIYKNSIRFDENYKVGEDLRFNLLYFNHVESAYFSYKIIYDYTINESGLTLTNQKERGSREIDLLDFIYSYYKENNFNLKFISKKIAKSFFYIDDVKLCMESEKYTSLLKLASSCDMYSKILFFLINNKFQKTLNFILKFVNNLR